MLPGPLQEPDSAFFAWNGGNRAGNKKLRPLCGLPGRLTFALFLATIGAMPGAYPGSTPIDTSG